jgi:hypothetical protein
MNLSAQHISQQPKDIIVDKKNTDNGARVVQEEVENGEEVHDPANTNSVLDSVRNQINNACEHECPDNAVRLLNADCIDQLTGDRVPGHEYSIPSLSRTKFLAHQV